MKNQCLARAFAALAAVFAVAGGCSRGAAPPLPYSAFLVEVKAGNVDSLTIEQRKATVRLKNPSNNVGSSSDSFVVVIPPGDTARADLIDLLEEHEVIFQSSDGWPLMLFPNR